MPFLKRLMNVFFPRTCAACGADVPAEGEHAVCDGCWDGVGRLEGLACLVCGMPLAAGGMRCGECRKGRRGFRFLRTAGIYEGSLQRMVIRFKFGGREELARPLGRLLADMWKGEPRLAPVDGAVSVPLHWTRERRRGYNQALLLAKEFGRRTETPVWEGVLRRRRATKPQTELGRDDRGKNVRDAFEVRHPDAVRGKSLLIIDDVCTTGATLESCARALKAAGARRVGAIAVARQLPF